MRRDKIERLCLPSPIANVTSPIPEPILHKRRRSRRHSRLATISYLLLGEA